MTLLLICCLVLASLAAFTMSTWFGVKRLNTLRMMGYVGGCHVWSAFDVVAMYKELSLSTVATSAFIRTEIQSDTAASKKSMRLQRSFWIATEWIEEILGR